MHEVRGITNSLLMQCHYIFISLVLGCSFICSDSGHSRPSNANLSLDAMAGMHINHLLNLIVTAQKNARSVMDVLWNDTKHTFHAAVDGLTAGCAHS